MIAWIILGIGLFWDLYNVWMHTAVRITERRRPSSVLVVPVLFYAVGVVFLPWRFVQDHALAVFAGLAGFHVFAAGFWPRLLDALLPTGKIGRTPPP